MTAVTKLAQYYWAYLLLTGMVKLSNWHTIKLKVEKLHVPSKFTYQYCCHMTELLGRHHSDKPTTCRMWQWFTMLILNSQFAFMQQKEVSHSYMLHISNRLFHILKHPKIYSTAPYCSSPEPKRPRAHGSNPGSAIH
jgi:hypothetical protein